MASIISQDFNAGPNGAVATTTQLGASSITGTAPTYDNTDPINGSFALLFPTAGGSVRWDYAPASTVWHSFYFKTPATAPTANESLATWFSGTTQVGSLRVNTDMTMSIRDVNSGAVSTSSALPTATWCRVALRCTPGTTNGHQLRVYVGANKNGLTPSYDISTTATNSSATATDNFRVGTITSGWVTTIDRLRSDNATEPGPVTGTGAPTVSAGPDLTKDTGSAPFTITGTEVIGGGPIASRVWRIVSGTTVALTNSSTQTVTVTPPAATGSTVLGYQATDNLGQVSAEDTMTITWVVPGQSFLPVGDVATASWTATPPVTPFAGNIDELVPDASDYVSSPDTPTGQEYKFRLESKPAPATTSGVYLELMLWLSSSVTSQSTVVKLYDSNGTTVRKTVTFTDLTTTPTIRQIALTSTEVGTITGWTSGLVVGVAPTLT